MTVVSNNAEGGTNGTAVTGGTGGNSGGASGSILNTVTAGTGGAITFSNAEVNNGQLSYYFLPAAATDCYVQFNLTGGSTAASARCYAYFTGGVTAATQFFRFNSTASNSAVIVIANTGVSSNKFGLETNGVAVYGGNGSALPMNTWLRFELQVTIGTGTGFVTASVYVGDSLTPFDTYTSYSASTGTGTYNTLYVGKLSATGNFPGFYIDDIAGNDGNTNRIGPVSYGFVTGTTSISNAVSIGL